MAKYLRSVLLLMIFLLPACAPTSIPPTVSTIPTTPPTTPTTIPSATPRPPVTLQQDGSLYAGPGNAGFEQVASLKAGTDVRPMATFGDFVQVAASVDGQELHGYVWKNILAALPAGLPALAGASVPWEPLYLPDCSPGDYTAATDVVVFSNDSSAYSDTESSAIPLAGPLKIAIGSAAATGDGSPVIKILGSPEQPSGDWWNGITRLDLGTMNGNYYIGIRDGTKAEAVVYQELPIRADQAIQLAFDQAGGKSFRILDGNGQVILSMDLTTTQGVNLPNGMFPNGVVYIGTSLPAHSTFTVTGLRIGVPASGEWVLAQDGYYTQPGLAELAAARHITIGTEFTLRLTSDPRYCLTMQREFNLAALSEFSTPAVWLGPGEYDFSVIDQAVDYASRHGWRIRASHLIWGDPNYLPAWLKDSNYSKDEYIQILEQYIKDVVGRYRGRVQEWSIANEATIRSWTPGADFWNDKIGPEYIAHAFQAARQADPNGVLIFNDVNNQSSLDPGGSGVVNKMVATVMQLKSQGVPIDVVGMQMHLFQSWETSVPPQKADVIATMQKFAALGVRIYITEMDVILSRQAGSQAEKWDFEAGVYGDIMEACLESGVCDSFATWGISDATSWISCASTGCLDEKNADPLMFDPSYAPKPAYFAVRDALQAQLAVTPAATPTK